MSPARRPDPAERPDTSARMSSEPTVPAARMRRATPRPAVPPRPPAATAPPPAAPDRGRDSRWVTALLGSVIAVCVALAAAILLLGFWKPGFFRTTRLNINDVQAAVQQILTDDITGYGITGVGAVTCNDGRSPKVKVGASFTCRVTVDGADRTVTVTIEDRDGTYGVSAPR